MAAVRQRPDHNDLVLREAHHFECLAQDLRERQGKLRIWSAAASTGEEPYSIAMVVDETLGAQARTEIVASDIDTTVLATAERGIYDAASRGLSPARLQRHFLRGKGTNEGHIRVRPALARRVSFRALNLVDSSWDLGGPFHIVFCRNVMIYFDAPTQRQVLERLHAAMLPDGLLYVGHSENFTQAREWFRLRGKTVYLKV
jgi:chemotaxis protein methyltransferase CheR